MKRFLWGIVWLVISGVLVACSNQTNANETTEINELKKQIEQLSMENKALQITMEQQKKFIEENINNNSSVILKKDIQTYPQSLFKEAAFDINDDGKEEIIELYVNAEKMEDGMFAWDDGQTWLLVVKDGEDTYPLFDDFVQLGSIDFSTAKFDGKPGIVMLETGHGDKSIHKIAYNQNEKGFVRETIYKIENSFQHYTQPASYAFFKDAYELMQLAFTEKAARALDENEDKLKELRDRAEIFNPIEVNLWNAQRLFETAGELNPELSVSVERVIDLLNDMVREQPTEGQLKVLRSICDVFKENESSQLIIEEENQIHPDIMAKFEKIKFILNEGK
ncbi:hypothetical protein [Bacillus sp. S/N-304-OC-R1]|uniref:hypothetical protein n=1 Tax=Bacillus sp. S/N-304-OC-R1 TaxID=2758034 RepID=UPI001C8E810E|nr:hypothetical protein [Bacillus sp. S/N-304-OC-R1]MBY0121764.1 hypothetical protein [Bacillus sp. S/N-304-OC-R1]